MSNNRYQATEQFRIVWVPGTFIYCAGAWYLNNGHGPLSKSKGINIVHLIV